MVKYYDKECAICGVKNTMALTARYCAGCANLVIASRAKLLSAIAPVLKENAQLLAKATVEARKKIENSINNGS